MGKLFDKFANIDVEKVKAGIDLGLNSIPWVVGFTFFIGGAYGLESFLGIDFSRKSVENLKKNKMISDPQKDFYTLLGNKIIDEAEYNKIKNKQMEKISDENSVLAIWKSVYDK